MSQPATTDIMRKKQPSKYLSSIVRKVIAGRWCVVEALKAKTVSANVSR